MTSIHKHLILATSAFSLCLHPLHSQPLPLLLDFGPTSPTGALTNSPYHAVSGNTAFDIWNVLGTAGSSSLKWGDDAPATGVSVNLGVSPNNNIINFANPPGFSSALGTAISSGVFTGNSVGKDAIFHGSTGQKNVIGLKIVGLAPGLYDVFAVGINTNEANNTLIGMNIGALATGDVATLDITSLTPTTVTNNGSTALWTEDGNYARFSVTLTVDDPVLTLFALSDNATRGRGFLNSVQVIAIPEPSTFVLVMGAVVGSLAFRRRR